MSNLLKGDEMLQRTFDMLRSEWSKRDIALSHPEFSKIDDEEKGSGAMEPAAYLSYTSLSLLETERTLWILGRGKKVSRRGSRSLCESDIVAVRAPLEFRSKPEGYSMALFAKKVHRGQYFQHSLLLTLVDGSLAVGNASEWEAMHSVVLSLRGYVSQKCMLSDGPLLFYKEDAVPYLTREIKRVLLRGC